MATARPCATLTPHADGPVVGRFGGAPLLPAGFLDLPQRTHLIASLDLAALPEDATNLPLPPDGLLHLFARSYDDGLEAGGEAVYVPAGTAVAERSLDHGYHPQDAWAHLDRDPQEGVELRLHHDVSLPDNESLLDPAEYPHANELRNAWAQVRNEDHPPHSGPRLQIDGFPTDAYGETDLLTASAWLAARTAGKPLGKPANPGETPRPEDWALLTQWYGAPYIGGDVYWTITRQNLTARRFDEVTVLGLFEGPG
ncbi:DUF1963 domain-containing protein [Streptomyces sp. NPDC048565]|uniref:DUF1963 domain-containing protein n=1 Tax=Streptomyces sp. NPDC048565 TaxID=3155266 RepID=UPI00342AFDB2